MRCSIIVPTYNRPHQIPPLLQSLRRLRYPDCEIIIVDDGSTVGDLGQLTLPENARVVRQANGGPAMARNTGARLATGDLLAFTDDDCRPHPNWLAPFAKQFEHTPDALFGGQVVNGLPNNPYAVATQHLIDFLRGDPPVFFPSNNIAIGRTRFHTLGGFSESFPLAAGEDRDFCDRANRLVYCPNAIIYHDHHLTLRRYWRQHANYGRGAWQLRNVRASAGKRHFSSLTYYSNLLSTPVRAHGATGLRTSGLLLLAQFATAFGMLHAASSLKYR